MVAATGSARDRLGMTLSGKYLLEEVLGVGGTAVVYRAQHRNGHRVAVKMLHDHLSTLEDVRRRFMREAYLANMLDHPGTVRILDDGDTEEGAAFLVLELIDGETLEDRRVRLGGTIPWDEVLGYVDQLLAVLEVAHAQNVVHRDIKPSNLLVTKEGMLKVLDFGIARLVDDLGSATVTRTGQMVGTPAFMPPEQALSKPKEIDAQSDLWAAGATAFTLMSGQLVHIAESSSEHLVKAATMHARSIATVLPGVPEGVEALIAKALAFYKRDRWASAREMRHELWKVRLEPGKPIGTASSPPPSRNPLSDAPTLIGRSSWDGRTSPVPNARDDSARPITTDATPATDRARPKPLVAAAMIAAAAATLAFAGFGLHAVATKGPASATTSSPRSEPTELAPPAATTGPVESARPPEPKPADPPEKGNAAATAPGPVASTVPGRVAPKSTGAAGATGATGATGAAPPKPPKKPPPAPTVDIYRPF